MSESTIDAPKAKQPTKRAEDLKPKQAVDTKALEEALEALNTTNKDLEDRLLRAVAEQKNISDRARKDVADAQAYGFRNFAQSMLPVFDALDQSIASITQDETVPSSLAEGLTMTQDMLIQTLEQHQIEVIDPLNETFDPNKHDAISMQITDEIPPKTIVQVIQKGYRIKDRLLRPALVVVSKEK